MTEPVADLSDDQLLDRAARYEAELRRGRRMEAEGKAIIKANIDEFVMCQNEFYIRLSRRVAQAADDIEAAAP